MELPLKKNQEIILTVDDLSSEGQGIGRYEGYAVFVDGVLPLEQAIVRIIKTTPSYAVGQLKEILQPSSQRVIPPCPVYAKCGGCQLQHLSYTLQLTFKKKAVVDALERIGGIKNISVEEIASMNEPWRYRAKSAFPVGNDKGRAVIGFFSPRSHRIVDISSCMIQDASGDSVIAAVREWINKYKILPYDEVRRLGLVRHVMFRSVTDGGVMVVIVTNGKELPHPDRLIAILKNHVRGICSVIQNINTAETNVILGPKNITLWGRETIEETLNGLKFSISPNSFFQVNIEQTKKLYEKVLEYAAPERNRIVIDAFCGTGTITLLLAHSAKKVYGIEFVREAVNDARDNAKRNGIQNAEFICGRVDEEIKRLSQNGVQPDTIILDPPRKGCSGAELEAAAATGAKTIVYVSCNPATMARDAAILVGKGYAAKAVTPVDMFPQTIHVECCLLLTRQE
ncbi:MAG: 23S rRNA (uracil(1939)-C(5))-methyltransferase RlmD [Bacillota bacterium]|nr:23S rRNA (uracil(1939)-C(5))-methyltransferase RlmD [Bacillota bacterium]